LTLGLKPVETRSGSVPRGMYDVLREIAERIGNATGSPYYAYSKLDEALRRGEAPVIDGREFNIEPALTAARQVAAEAVTEMKRALQGTSDVDNIVLVGGSAFFFKPVIESMLTNRHFITVKDSEFSNLRGFQLAGSQWAANRARESAPAA
jgi:plasmid segregation protein ParM